MYLGQTLTGHEGIGGDNMCCRMKFYRVTDVHSRRLWQFMAQSRYWEG